jgi:HptB-dependent secretion and biofilm anti anti-sigma factor
MLQVDDHDDTVTIRISGRFDYRMIKDFQPLLSRSPQTWVVDLSSVDYVDSSALGMLLLLRERVQGEAQRVHLRGVHGQPRDVLVMAKFDRMFKVE